MYREPREIIESIPGLELVELPKNGSKARCCGGPIRASYGKIRNKLADKTLSEAEDLEVNYLVTACPTCFHNFFSSSISYDLEVVDIADLISYAAGLSNQIPSIRL